MTSVRRSTLGNRLADPWFCEALFDRVPDVVFFVKDVDRRYVVVNETLAARLGSSKEDLLGKTASEAFPGDMGTRFADQDREVLETGHAMHDCLELHMYLGGAEGWCITDKVPLVDEVANVVGVAGASRDVHDIDADRSVYSQLATALDHLQRHLDEPVRIAELAGLAQMTVARFERLVRKTFRLTPSQLLRKYRLEVASQLLRGTRLPISEVANRAGFTDHSAFARQFRLSMGVTPTVFRAGSPHETLPPGGTALAE